MNVRISLPVRCAVLGAAAVLVVCAVACGPLTANSGAANAAPVDLLASGAAAAAEPWGTIEGQATWAGAALPTPTPANVDKDQAVCLKNGPINKEDYVVNPKNKGVKWVVVWLVDADDFKKDLPIHPDLKVVKDKKVVLDQPCCKFEPHIICLREGQDLEVKNSGTVPHNTKIDSPGDNPSINPLIPAGQSTIVKDWKAATAPSTVGCSIHGWMNGYIRVFNHPYFAVTDEDGKFKIEKAPAGKYHIVAWQESIGYLSKTFNHPYFAVTDEDGMFKIEKAPAGKYHIVAWQESIGYLSKTFKKGDPIEIKADGVTEVKYEVKPKE